VAAAPRRKPFRNRGLYRGATPDAAMSYGNINLM
jgi:hypothetical protein